MANSAGERTTAIASEESLCSHPCTSQQNRLAYEAFADLDTRLFPMEALGGLDEKDIIEPVRVSPDLGDAAFGFGRRERAAKVAGEEFSAFGGFFKRSWRANDILVGRLDGLYRLTTELLDEQRVASRREKSPWVW